LWFCRNKMPDHEQVCIKTINPERSVFTGKSQSLTSVPAVCVAAASAPSDRTAGAVVALEVEAAVSASLFSKQRFDFLAGSPTSSCTEQLLLACPDPSLAVSEVRFRFLKVLLDKLLSTGDNRSDIK